VLAREHVAREQRARPIGHRLRTLETVSEVGGDEVPDARAGFGLAHAAADTVVVVGYDLAAAVEHARDLVVTVVLYPSEGSRR
jgi:hypothetical protein